MMPEESKQLWAAVNELRYEFKQFAQTFGVSLARLESLLSERCENRSRALDDLRELVQSNAAAISDTKKSLEVSDRRISALERNQFKVMLVASAVSSFVTAVVIAVVNAIVRGWLG